MTKEEMVKATENLLVNKFNHGSDSPRFRWFKEDTELYYSTPMYAWYRKKLSEKDLSTDEDFFKAIVEFLLGVEYIESAKGEYEINLLKSIYNIREE